MKKLGLYLHVPFCVRKCAYCDFYSGAQSAETRQTYVRALCKHLAAVAPTVSDFSVDTVYMGGGTPTLLDTAEIHAILDTVRAHFALEAGAEITAECNPVTNADGMMEGLLASGITAEQLIYYGLEYKFVTMYVTGKISYDDMVRGLEIAIHRFAKRQMTWFRGMEKRGTHIHWIDASLPRARQVELIKNLMYDKK